jgi:hypothetical protein
VEISKKSSTIGMIGYGKLNLKNSADEYPGLIPTYAHSIAIVVAPPAVLLSQS